MIYKFVIYWINFRFTFSTNSSKVTDELFFRLDPREVSQKKTTLNVPVRIFYQDLEVGTEVQLVREIHEHQLRYFSLSIFELFTRHCFRHYVYNGEHKPTSWTFRRIVKFLEVPRHEAMYTRVISELIFSTLHPERVCTISSETQATCSGNCEVQIRECATLSAK